MLNILLNDNVKARKINDKGDYDKVIRGVDLIDSQNYFMHDDFSVIEEEEENIEESFYFKLKHLLQNNVIEKIYNRNGK